MHVCAWELAPVNSLDENCQITYNWRNQHTHMCKKKKKLVEEVAVILDMCVRMSMR